MKPTIEQEKIILAAKNGSNIEIQAGAGCGKSSTLKLVAEALPKKNILYLVFNKENAEEAKAKFPANVEARTINSLAYREIVKYPKSSWGQRLSSLRWADIIVPKDVVSNIDTWKMFIKQTITLFCQSDKRNIIDFIKKEFDYNVFKEALGLQEDVSEKVKTLYEHACEDYWLSLVTDGSKKSISHDVYLKLYQLSEPFLFFDIIAVDEFQDVNPVMLDIVLRQKHAQIIVVGDPNQSIYAFNGAINGFKCLDKSFEKLTLSESFRFTQAIADKAREVLAIKGENFPLKGLAVEKPDNTKAILCRTNVGVLQNIFAFHAKGEKVSTNVNLKEMKSKLFHIEQANGNKNIPFPVGEFRHITNKDDLEKAIHYDDEVKAIYDLLYWLYGNNLNVFGFFKIIDATVVEKADVAVMTGHKAKGFEYGEVWLHSDFEPAKDREGNPLLKNWVERMLTEQELNLLYIAVTRAKYKVHLPEYVQRLVRGEFGSLG